MSKGTGVRSVRIDDETWNAAQAEAKRRGITVSELIRRALAGMLLVLAVGLLSGGTAPAPAVAGPAPAAAVAEAPAPKAWDWACDRPMTFAPMPGPGVDDHDVRVALSEAIAAVGGFGYDMEIGDSLPYRTDVRGAAEDGQVVVVVTMHASEQSALGINSGVATGDYSQLSNELKSAVILINADPAIGELSGNLLTHELGHVLGLDHKEGTVMGTAWPSPDTFDAAESAALSCL